ncbi:hypothetical protein FA09DRAFT_328703 [Tilletiopsis washingtonensis]|uniref:Uncharacterized protein n=1 Tax=Tilletiopsis washingtonensis TaxID=58919 RepID=A0A316ZC51_9BASI|nr:hypothetical protein FA09DRAFT_328703 [Tilletiopsis washingtonensis]PWN99280.1 hypothetical protein FA09DRAFT_328703 [Tilletiopsis washingtonensis]
MPAKARAPSPALALLSCHGGALGRAGPRRETMRRAGQRREARLSARGASGEL